MQPGKRIPQKSDRRTDGRIRIWNWSRVYIPCRVSEPSLAVLRMFRRSEYILHLFMVGVIKKYNNKVEIYFIGSLKKACFSVFINEIEWVIIGNFGVNKLLRAEENKIYYVIDRSISDRRRIILSDCIVDKLYYD